MGVKTQWVSDEVWAELDPKAGAIDRVTGRRLAVTAALLAGVTAIATAVWLSGLIYPRLAWSGAVGMGFTAYTDSKTISTDVVITNNGWTSVRVVGVGQDGPGLQLIGVDGSPHIRTDTGRTVPFTLQPGQTATVSVTYKITDCAAVPFTAFDIAVRVDRPWGTQTVGIALPHYPMTITVDGLQHMYDREWQRGLADQACGTNH